MRNEDGLLETTDLLAGVDELLDLKPYKKTRVYTSTKRKLRAPEEIEYISPKRQKAVKELTITQVTLLSF